MEETGRKLPSFFVAIAYQVDPAKPEEHDRAYEAIYDYYRAHCPEVRSARIYSQLYGSLIPGGRGAKLEVLEFDSMEARAKHLEAMERDHPEVPGMWAAWRSTTVPGSIQFHVFTGHRREVWIGPQ